MRTGALLYFKGGVPWLSSRYAEPQLQSGSGVLIRKLHEYQDNNCTLYLENPELGPQGIKA